MSSENNRSGLLGMIGGAGEISAEAHRSMQQKMFLKSNAEPTYTLAEAIALINSLQNKSKPKTKGQPTKSPLKTNDAKRAYVLYAAIQKLRANNHPLVLNGNIPSLLLLIEAAKESFDTRSIFAKPAAPNKMYASIRRGKKILNLGADWSLPLDSPFLISN